MPVFEGIFTGTIGGCCRVGARRDRWETACGGGKRECQRALRRGRGCKARRRGLGQTGAVRSSRMSCGRFGLVKREGWRGREKGHTSLRRSASKRTCRCGTRRAPCPCEKKDNTQSASLFLPMTIHPARRRRVGFWLTRSLLSPQGFRDVDSLARERQGTVPNATRCEEELERIPFEAVKVLPANPTHPSDGSRPPRSRWKAARRLARSPGSCESTG